MSDFVHRRIHEYLERTKKPKYSTLRFETIMLTTSAGEIVYPTAKAIAGADAGVLKE